MTGPVLPYGRVDCAVWDSRGDGPRLEGRRRDPARGRRSQLPDAAAGDRGRRAGGQGRLDRVRAERGDRRAARGDRREAPQAQRPRGRAGAGDRHRRRHRRDPRRDAGGAGAWRRDPAPRPGLAELPHDRRTAARAGAALSAAARARLRPRRRRPRAGVSSAHPRAAAQFTLQPARHDHPLGAAARDPRIRAREGPVGDLRRVLRPDHLRRQLRQPGEPRRPGSACCPATPSPRPTR